MYNSAHMHAALHWKLPRGQVYYMRTMFTAESTLCPVDGYTHCVSGLHDVRLEVGNSCL